MFSVSNQKEESIIGIASITRYTHVHDKKSNAQGSSSNVIKVISHTTSNCSLRNEFAPSGSKVFPILKRDIIVEDQCLIQ